MLDASDIIQANQGSSGTATSTAFNATLGTATTAGNSVVAIFANADANRLVSPPSFVTWLPLISISSASPVPAVHGFGYPTPGGETTFACTVDGVGDAVCWWIAEVSGLATMVSAENPDGTPTNIPVGLDTNGSTGSLFGGTACNTNNPGTKNTSGDDLIVSYGCAERTTAGAVPAFSSIADTTGGQPGTWTRSGSTVATTRAAGVNIRLDVFIKFTTGVQAFIDATYTWASTVPGATAGVLGVMADIVKPQETRGRASTNSMV